MSIINIGLNDTYDDKKSSYYSHDRPELLQFIPPSIKSVLDIGCGAGNFGQTVKKLYNCEVWGIEPNKEAAIEAGKKIDKSINNIFLKKI